MTNKKSNNEETRMMELLLEQEKLKIEAEKRKERKENIDALIGLLIVAGIVLLIVL